MFSLKYDWEHDYVGAILETDNQKLVHRIATAQSTMLARVNELNMDHGGTPQEQEALAAALAGLQKLRTERLGPKTP